MTEQELHDLIPLYLNGTLSADERKRVEDELKHRSELQDDLRIWELAKLAAESDDEMNDHPTAEEIVDYATGAMRDGNARVTLERHIQSCDGCMKEVTVIREMSLEETPAPVLRPQWLRFKNLRLSVVLPLAAVLILAIILLSRDEPSVQIQVAATVVPDSAVQTPAERKPVVVTYTLPVSIVMLRSPNALNKPVPSFILQEADSITLVIPVLYSKTAAAYSVRLTGDRGVVQQQSLAAGERKNGYAYIRLTLRSDALPPGTYSVNAREILRPDASLLEPEDYSYSFTLVQPQNKKALK